MNRITLVSLVIIALASLVTSTASASDWIECADEHGNCSVSGEHVVRYGAQGKFVFKITTGDIGCNNDVFGDPIHGTVKKCHIRPVGGAWSECAKERGACSLRGDHVVRYGANKKFVYKVTSGNIACRNDVFGDPVPGTVKACHARPLPPRWNECAKENGSCAVSGEQLVRYGANGRFAYKVASGSIDCNNGVFGDPIQDTVKACHARPLRGPWRECAKENGSCKASGVNVVRYGAKGKFVYRVIDGGTPCSNDVFGDPIYGTVKACSVHAAP